MARFDTRQIPVAGQYYDATSGAQSALGEGFLVCITDVELSSITFAPGVTDPDDALIGVALPAGTQLHGQITGFTVTSGVVFHVRG
jgi:hypothetical protein